MAIDGVGNVPVPLRLEDLLKLKAIASKAPYGKGSETCFDATVRDSWQIDKGLVSFDMAWVAKMVNNLQHIGVERKFDVNLYKLLIYEQGGHFLKHKDTEKEPGMFGTYLVQIPTEGGFSGGEFELHHCGKSSATIFPRRAPHRSMKLFSLLTASTS